MSIDEVHARADIYVLLCSCMHAYLQLRVKASVKMGVDVQVLVSVCVQKDIRVTGAKQVKFN